MKKLVFFALALGMTSLGSLQAQEKEGKNQITMKKLSKIQAADQALLSPPPIPSVIGIFPNSNVSTSSDGILSSPPPLPPFTGFEEVSPSNFITMNPGSVIEFWFNKNGISEKEINRLDQIPGDQQVIIRKIVQAYQLDMQKALLEMRPHYQSLQNDITGLKFELSGLILLSKDQENNTENIKKIITQIETKNTSLKNLTTVQDQIVQTVYAEMTDKITEVINAWISEQVSQKSNNSLRDLITEAEAQYGLKWE